MPGYTGTATTGYSYCYYPDPLSPVTYSVRIHVSVRYGHPLFIPLVGNIIDGIDGTPDGRYTVTVQEDMRVESLPYKSPPSGMSACANP